MKTGKRKAMRQYRKAVLLEVQEKMSAALSGMKEMLGEKKFNKKIRKAAKGFARNIKPASEPVTKRSARKMHRAELSDSFVGND
jgi:hypothetical protein